MKRQPTVFIVDDDAAMRESTAMLLKSAGMQVEIFSAADEFLDQYRPAWPGCLVTDLSMPGMTGMQMVAQLRERGINIPILIVSGTGTIPLVVEGMRLGVVDFLEKPTDPELLVQKVREALERDSKQRAEAADLAPIAQKLANLTPREKEILAQLVTGLSSKQIAMALEVSIKTVDNHRANIMQKTGAVNSADLTRMAMLMGIAKAPAN